MATLSASAIDGQATERKFYSRMALFMVAIILIGFAPSFYLRGLVHSPRPNPSLPPHIMIHGLMFTAWLLLFVVQTQLVAAGRRELHMKLGAASFVLAVALVPLMYLTAVWQVARANQMPFTDPLNWTIVPLVGIVPLSIMLWIGWTRRREAQWHKRAMLCSGLMIMEPGIGRIPIGPPIFAVHLVGSMLAVAIFVPLILWDRKTIGHWHPVTMLGFWLTVATMTLRAILLSTGSWAAIAAHLPGVGA